MSSSYSRYEIIHHYSPSKTLINPFSPSSLIPHHDLSFLNPSSLFHFPTPFDSFPQIESSFNRLVLHRANSSESYIKELSDRVSSLESKLDRLVEAKREKKKYTWTAEIKGGVEDRKYKCTAEIEGKKNGERKYQWVTEIKGKDDEKRTYTWKAAIGGEKKVTKKKKSSSSSARVVEIDDEAVEEHRSLVLRQAYAKRAVAVKNKGKKKELSPEDAAMMIQMTFKAYLIRRSKTLRALRELAIAKTKLKELRSLFHNFSYRNRIARDAEERQKFSEKIIVLLLTVDAIEGVDLMVRAAKRSIVDEVESMLDVVDPQPTGKSLSFRRRTFDMPTGGLQREIAEGVAQVVQMIEEENATFEACL